VLEKALNVGYTVAFASVECDPDSGRIVPVAISVQIGHDSGRMPRPELAACGRDVLSLAAVDHHSVVTLEKDLLKGQKLRLVVGYEGRSRMGVKGDQIYFCFCGSHQLCQTAGVGQTVVEALR
jgi:hypothetical protein